MTAIWDAAAAATADDAIGVRAAACVPAGAYGAFDHFVMTSATTGHALAATARHFRLANGGAELRLHALRDAVAVQLHAPETAPEHRPRSAQYTFAIILLRSRLATGRAWAPREVHFTAGEPVHVEELRRVFRAPLRFGQRDDQLLLDPSTLALPHSGHDPLLHEILESRLAGDLPIEFDFLARCRESALAALWQGERSIVRVADNLTMSVRSLQRKLRANGTSYRELLDELRFEHASTLLRSNRAPATDISRALGFSEPSVFYRAFRRWTGTTPHDWRIRSLPEPR